jgi:hypothetical protein
MGMEREIAHENGMKKRKKKGKIACPPIGDCNPADCVQPEMADSCSHWKQYRLKIKTVSDTIAEIAIPKVKSAKQKKVRKKDLSLYKSLISYVENVQSLSGLISTKNHLIEKYGEIEKSSCAYLREYYGSTPAIGAEEHVNSLLGKGLADLVLHGMRLSEGTLYTEEEQNLNERIVSAIYFLTNEYRLISQDLFSGKHGIKAKQWYVDIMGRWAERYLPNWKSFKKRTSRKPDFKESYETLKKFANGSTPKELGFKRNSYHHLRYEIVPQGVIWLLYYMHAILYGPVNVSKVSTVSIKSACVSVIKILKDFHPDTAAMICDIAQDLLRAPSVANFRDRQFQESFDGWNAIDFLARDKDFMGKDVLDKPSIT